MKSIIAFMISSTMALAVAAQTTNKVNIIFKSVNKNTANYQVSVDGNNYYSNTNTKNTANYRIALNNVTIGSHDLKVYRLKNKSVAYNGKIQNTLIYSKTFEVRNGYDMNITVLASGKVQFSEQAIEGYSNTDVVVAMNATNFNTLLQNIKARTSQSQKGQLIRDAFTNTNNHFSTAQVRQLLTMITSESDRLDLAKLSYRSVTDLSNFAQLSNLFNSTAKRQEFNSYVTLGGEQTTTPTVQSGEFSSLLQAVNSNWSQSQRGQLLNDAFANTNNFYTTAQLRQLLTLITSESDRLDLVKASYRSVTDRSNFASLADLFNNTGNRTEFNNYVYAQSNSVTPTRAQITDYQFNQLLQSVKNQWSQSLKGQTIRDAFANTNYYYSTAQARQLLTQVTAESDRLELAKSAYKSITDPANFASLADLFSIASNRTEFNNYIYAQGGVSTNSTDAKTAMANGDFELLVLGVRSNLIQPLKVNAVANILNNPNYYFTTAQVRTLIALINSEASRLDLAKLSYRSVTDRANFPQIYDLFSTQSMKDGLADYVKNYQGM